MASLFPYAGDGALSTVSRGPPPLRGFCPGDRRPPGAGTAGDARGHGPPGFAGGVLVFMGVFLGFFIKDYVKLGQFGWLAAETAVGAGVAILTVLIVLPLPVGRAARAATRWAGAPVTGLDTGPR